MWTEEAYPFGPWRDRGKGKAALGQRLLSAASLSLVQKGGSLEPPKCQR